MVNNVAFYRFHNSIYCRPVFDGNISDPRLFSAVAGRIITVLLIITDRHKYLVFYLFLFTFSPVIFHTGLATYHTSNFCTTEFTDCVMQPSYNRYLHSLTGK